MQELKEFIHQSPSPWHATETARDYLNQNGFKECFESEENWDLQPGDKFYVIRGGGSLIAMEVPSAPNGKTAIHAVGSHTDSPCFRLKANPISPSKNPTYFQLEVYGGVLLASWLDRDLKFAGRIVGEDESGKLKEALWQSGSILRIPQLAIHLNRDVNSKGLLLNAQTQILGFCADQYTEEEFHQMLQRETGLKKIYSWDLCTADMQEPELGGVKGEFFYAPRLDNLAMFQASLKSLIESEESEALKVAVSFQHEEVGSASAEGAESDFLEKTLQRVFEKIPELGTLRSNVGASLLLSADMAHAYHPGYADKFDPQNHPLLNQGPVLKFNANVRYATDARTVARVRQLAENKGIPLQVFHNRNDMGCGSTIGPANATKLGIPVLDLGNAMHSMHSCREMTGTKDHEQIITLFKAFFEMVPA